MNKETREKRARIKKKKRIRKLSLYSALICSVTIIIFIFLLCRTGIVPKKIMTIIWTVLIIVILPMLLIGLIPKIKIKIKIKQSLICVVLSVLMIALSILMPSYTGKISKIFIKIPEEGTKNINLYVLKESVYESVEDLAGLDVGVQSRLDSESQEFAIKAVNKEIAGNDISTNYCNSIYDAIDKLYNSEVCAILLNEDYIDIVVNNSDYSDFNDKTELIYSVPQKISTNMDLNEVNITNECFVVAITAIDEWGYDDINAPTGMRSDVNIVAAINPIEKKVCLITIPRDGYLRFIPWDDGVIERDKLTHISLISITKWMDTLEKLLNVDVNYYFRVSFSSLVDIVDAIGGIDIYNPFEFESKENLTYDSESGVTRGEPIIFEEGDIHLCGTEALAYCRERDDLAAGDIARNEHQAIVLKACIDKACSVQIISRLNNLMKSLEGKFCSNIKTEEIYALINMQLNDMADWQIDTLSIGGEPAWEYSYMEGDYRSVVEIDDNDLQTAIEKIQSTIN